MLATIMRCLARSTAAVALLAACSGAAPASGADSSGRLLPSGAQGIDLSHHNGRIDWGLLGTEAIDFAYLKATEGTGHADPRFQENWRSAMRLGWRIGAYHFYRLCQDGAPQAANFIRQVEIRPGTLPPAVDLEFAHNCEPAGTRAETLAELRVFLAALETEYGAIPVIYTTPDFHAAWLAGEGFDGYPLWVRSLDGPPDLPYALWQYAMDGRLNGVQGDVDLNRAAP